MARKLSKRGRIEGRKEFEPTEEQRLMVRMWVVIGYKQDEIRRQIINPQTGNAIDDETLTKHFRKELDHAYDQQTALVMSAYLKNCIGAPAEFKKIGRKLVKIREEIQADVGAQKHFLNVRLKRLGWAERTEISGPDGQAIPLRLESLSDAQLNALLQRIERAITQRPGSDGESEPARPIEPDKSSGTAQG